MARTPATLVLGLCLLGCCLPAHSAVPPNELPRSPTLPPTFAGSGCNVLPIADARAVQAAWGNTAAQGPGVGVAIQRAVVACAALGAQLTDTTPSPQKEALKGALFGCVSPHAGAMGVALAKLLYPSVVGVGKAARVDPQETDDCRMAADVVFRTWSFTLDSMTAGMCTAGTPAAALVDWLFSRVWDEIVASVLTPEALGKQVFSYQDAVEEFTKYSTLALFRLVDTCDGLAPGWDPKTPVPALPGVDKLFPAGGGPSLRWKIEKVEPRRGGPPGCLPYRNTLSQASRADAQGNLTPPSIIAAGSALTFGQCCNALRAFHPWAEANVLSYCTEKTGCDVYATSRTLPPPPFGPPQVVLTRVPVGTCLLMYGDLAGRSDMQLSAYAGYDTGIWVPRGRQ